MDEGSLREMLREAMALVRQERFAEAEAIYRAALERFGDDGLLCMNLAAALSSQGKLEESLPWHDRAASLRPNDPGVHFNRGRTLAGLGSHAEAVASFERTLQLAPDS